MADTPQKKKVSSTALEQERVTRDTAIARLNREASHYLSLWHRTVAEHPDLKGIDNEEAFKRARVRDETIPPESWSSYVEAERLVTQAKETAAKPLSELSSDSKLSSFLSSLKHQDHDEHHGAIYMDHDVRYQDILDESEALKTLREKHPELIDVPTLSMRDDGSMTLNPELIKHFEELGIKDDPFELEEQARETFNKKHTQSAEIYTHNEKNRIYKNQENDPAVIRVRRKIEKQIDQELEVMRRRGDSLETMNAALAEIRTRITNKAFEEFKNTYPDKGKYYSIAALTVQPSIPSSPAPTPVSSTDAASKSSDITDLSDKPNGNLILDETSVTKDPPVELPPPLPIITQSYDTEKASGDLILPRSVKRTVAPSTPQVDPEIPNIHTLRRPMPSPTLPVRQQPEPSHGGGAKPPLKGPPRLPFGGPGIKGTPMSLVRSVVMKNPYVIGGIIAVIFILIFIYILINLFGGASNDEETEVQKFPITIKKSVNKEEISNPPDDEEIIYSLVVSYPGTAKDIIVEDPIPQGAEYVSSSPQAKTLDEKGNETSDSKKIVKAVWSLKTITSSASESAEEEPVSVSYQKYTANPYFLPEPNGASDIEYSDEIMSNLNKLGSAVARNLPYLTTKFDAKYVDPFLSVIWVGAIEQSFGDTYSWNCQDVPSIKINDGCPNGYYSGGWQVGYGIQVSQAAGHLEEDFNAAYGAGSAENAKKVKEVGDTVIKNSENSSKGQITNPSSFPEVTISQLVQEANASNTASQQALAILLMDPNLGSITIAQEVAGDISARDNWRATMESWPGSYYKNGMQLFSNRMKAIAEKYTGTGSSSPETNFGSRNLTLTVKIKEGVSNTYLMNQATTKVVGGKSPSTPPLSNETVSLENVEKRLLPDPSTASCQQTETGTCGRSLERVKPNKIVMHTTQGITDADGIFEYFNSGSDNRGVGSHFMIGTDGKIIQMVELFKDSVEYAQAVGGYQNHISIEMGSRSDYDGKDAMTSEQYNAAKGLVAALMEKYNIPKGSIEYESITGNGMTIDDEVQGIFGHYQLNPGSRTDPGQTWLRDFRKEF